MTNQTEEAIRIEILKPQGKITKKMVKLFSYFSKSLKGFEFTTEGGEYPKQNQLKTIKFLVPSTSPRRVFFLLINFTAHIQNIPTPVKKGQWYGYMVGDLNISLWKGSQNLNVEI